MKYRLPIIGFLILFTSLTAYILQDYLSQKFFIPLINLSHFSWKIIGSLPQIFWWVLLILGLAVFISKAVNISIERKPNRVKAQTSPTGLSSDWNRMIDRANKGDYSRWLLCRKMANLVIAVLAYRNQISEEEVKESIISRKIQLPEEIRTFLLQGINSPSFQHFLDIEDENQPLKRDQNIEMDIEKIINFLETDIK